MPQRIGEALIAVIHHVVVGDGEDIETQRVQALQLRWRHLHGDPFLAWRATFGHRCLQVREGERRLADGRESRISRLLAGEVSGQEEVADDGQGCARY